jgi:hypothetical protein
VRLTTSLQVGAKYLGCVVCRFHIAAGAGSAPCQKPVTNIQKWFLSPTGRLNFGFILRETYCCAHHTFLLGFPTGPSTPHHQQVFWRRCEGKRGFLQGESLTSNLFTLLLFCLVSLLYFCLLLFIKNTKKIVPFVVVIFACLFLSC